MFSQGAKEGLKGLQDNISFSNIKNYLVFLYFLYCFRITFNTNNKYMKINLCFLLFNVFMSGYASFSSVKKGSFIQETIKNII